MPRNKIFALTFTLITACAIIIGCSKSAEPPSPIDPVKPQPGQEEVVISSLSVTHGAYNQSVTINGSGFNKDISVNKVLFNNKEALITAASTTQLTVSVPLSAGDGNVVVTNGTKSATGPTFAYDYTLMKTVLAGSTTAGSTDGKGTAASFSNPTGIAINSAGDVFVADAANSVIRKITKDGMVTTFAGNRTRITKDGIGTNASFDYITAMAIDKTGNLFIAEGKGFIRKITPSAEVSTIAGTGVDGYVNGNGMEARFDDIEAIAVNSNGDIFVTDRSNKAIRKITPAGQVSTFYQAAANIGLLTAIAFDSKDSLYFTDTPRDTQYRGTALYQLNNSTANPINTFNNSSFTGLALGIAADEKGNKYVLDGDGKILKISTTGENILLNSVLSNKATNALKPNIIQVYSALGMAVDKDGVCYIAEGNKILKIGLQ